MKVISLLVTNFKNDNRVHRMAKSLSQNGFPTTVVAWKKGDVLERENYKGVEVERVIVSADRWKRANLIVGAQTLAYSWYLIERGGLPSRR